MRPLTCLLLMLLLGGCSTLDLDRDYDPNRDFATYHSWSWRTPRLVYQPADPRLQSDLTEARISQAIANQLEQRGLRLVPAQQADLLAQSVLIVDERLDQVTTHYGGAWSGYWGATWLARPSAKHAGWTTR
ncbi:hypothetical protein NCCP436_23730 [Pseudomonas sp. NCCP-436]|nr:hypothetical protein NCCP436_23730 [Pseudomonas sp. NCCP-436]